jgi:hypothetical protein
MLQQYEVQICADVYRGMHSNAGRLQVSMACAVFCCAVMARPMLEGFKCPWHALFGSCAVYPPDMSRALTINDTFTGMLAASMDDAKGLLLVA